MWVSSFVVTLPDDPMRAAAISDAIRSMPVFEPGEAIGCRLPVVLEAKDGSTARHWHHWVEELPGVVHVDLAFVSFEDADRSVSQQQNVDQASVKGQR